MLKYLYAKTVQKREDNSIWCTQLAIRWIYKASILYGLVVIIKHKHFLFKVNINLLRGILLVNLDGTYMTWFSRIAHSIHAVQPC